MYFRYDFACSCMFAVYGRKLNLTCLFFSPSCPPWCGILVGCCFWLDLCVAWLLENSIIFTAFDSCKCFCVFQMSCPRLTSLHLLHFKCSARFVIPIPIKFLYFSFIRTVLWLSCCYCCCSCSCSCSCYCSCSCCFCSWCRCSCCRSCSCWCYSCCWLGFASVSPSTMACLRRLCLLCLCRQKATKPRKPQQLWKASNIMIEFLMAMIITIITVVILILLIIIESSSYSSPSFLAPMSKLVELALPFSMCEMGYVHESATWKHGKPQ